MNIDDLLAGTAGPGPLITTARAGAHVLACKHVEPTALDGLRLLRLSGTQGMQGMIVTGVVSEESFVAQWLFLCKDCHASPAKPLDLAGQDFVLAEDIEATDHGPPRDAS